MATPLPTNLARFSVAEICLAVGGALLAGAAEATCIGVSTDTRLVQADNVFFALRGESFDGHSYVSKALEKGAKAVVVSNHETLGAWTKDHPHAAVILVEDTLIALGALARFHRTRWGGTLIGLTGSVGKSTTKELCRAMLKCTLAPNEVHCTEGNLNNQVGIPITLFGLQQQHKVAIVEMGTSARGEIAYLANIARPDVGLLVSIGTAHALGLANAPRGAHEPWWAGHVEDPRQAVALEKRALLDGADKLAIAGADDPWCQASLAIAPSIKRVSFGHAPHADYRIEAEHPTARGTEVTISRRGLEPVVCAVALYGDALMNDVAGALAACDGALTLIGKPSLTSNELATLSGHFERMPHRFQVHENEHGPWVIDDTYNASPEAFALSVRTAATLAKGQARKLVVVVGEMRELGDQALRAHQTLGEQIVKAGARLVVGCGGMAAHVLEIATANRIPVESHESSTEAAKHALSWVQPNDLILVKGSRGARTEFVAEALLSKTLGDKSHAV